MNGKTHYNVLSISGGGFRGLFAASLLEHMQSGYGIGDLREHFDLFVGTSTGALVAAALAIGRQPRDVTEAFRKHGRTIFQKPSSMRSLYQKVLFLPQYDPRHLADAINELVPTHQHIPMKQLDARLAVTAVSTIDRRHRIYTSKPFADKDVSNISLLDALLASTAAPTFFKEHTVRGEQSDVLIDGGLAANAPVLIGPMVLHNALGISFDKIRILHVGTAAPTFSRSFDPLHGIKPWTRPLRGWISRASGATRDLVMLTLSAQEHLATELAKSLFKQRYVQLDAPDDLRSGPELEGLDLVTRNARQKLSWLADKTWEQAKYRPELRAFFPLPAPTLATRYGRSL
jgi:uncharacterized protein